MRPATTLEMIRDVEAAERLKFIPAPEAADLVLQLKRGEIIHPIWEDYGLRTNPMNGRASY